MSFYCPKCNTAILDSPGKGFHTGCIHFPLKKKETKTPEMPEFMQDFFYPKKHAKSSRESKEN